MKKLYFTTLICACFLSLSAQDTTIYYQSSTKTVKNIADANFYMKFSQAPNGMFNYERFCPDGVLQEKGMVSNQYALSKEGKINTYYSNGMVKDEMNYLAGYLNGIKSHYFPNGKLNYQVKINESINAGKKERTEKYLTCLDTDGKEILKNGNGYFKAYDRHLAIVQEGKVNNMLAIGDWKGYENGKLSFNEFYDNGKLVKGESFDGNGKLYSYNERNSRPMPKGGLANFYSYISDAMQETILQNNKKFKKDVLVRFTVEQSGNIKDIEVVKAGDTEMDKLIVDVVKSSPKWKPGLEYGKAVEFAYYMPISIK